MLEQVGMEIAAPNVFATCSSGRGRLLDYFVVSKGLKHVSDEPAFTSWYDPEVLCQAAVSWGPHGAVSFNMSRQPRQVHVYRLAKPKALPLEQYDGTYDEELWQQAEVKATAHLAQYRGCIMGKVHPVMKQHFRKREPQLLQLQEELGRQLALVAATAEIFVCLKAGVPDEQLRAYIGRSQWPTARRVPANTKHLQESRYSCQHADFWGATKSVLIMHHKVSTRCRAHPQSEQ